MRRPQISRRVFLKGVAAALAAPHACTAPGAAATAWSARAKTVRSIEDRIARMGKLIRERYRDPRRHFIFEYYPWYGTDPWRHWDGSGRTPPAELSASSLPLLGAYDSRAARTIEQHARWIAEAGVGAINLSWWGRGSYEDASVHVVMDVMRAFDIKVAFHLEPYSGERGARLVDDVTYILREYGDRRRWDTHAAARGCRRPRGTGVQVVRHAADSDDDGLQGRDDAGRTSTCPTTCGGSSWRASGARSPRTSIGSRSSPTRWTPPAPSPPASTRAPWAIPTSARTTGRSSPPRSIGETFRFPSPSTPASTTSRRRRRRRIPAIGRSRSNPDPDVRWDQESSREHAHQLCTARIAASLERTLAHQTDPQSANWRHGFLLVPVNSFNEWQEGTAFEPMTSYRDLSSSQRLLYHNATDGSYRLRTLRDLMEMVL